MTRAVRLFLVVAALAAAAGAEDWAGRLRERWRWRHLPPPDAMVGARSVRARADGSLLVLFRNGLAAYDGRGWTPIPHVAPLLARERAIEAAPLGRDILLLTFDALYRVAPGAEPQRLMPVDSAPRRRLARTPNGSYLIVRGNRIHELHAGGERVLAPTPGPNVNAAMLDPEGRLVCSVGSSIFIRRGETWEAVPGHEGASPKPLGIARNADGGVWFFSVAPPVVPLFWDGARLSRRPLPPDALLIQAHARGPDGRGLFATDRGDGLVFRDGDWRRVLIGDGVVRSLCVTPQGRFVVADASGRTRFCDLASRRWRTIRTDVAGLSSVVNALSRARRGGVWVGTDVGIGRWDGEEFRDVFREADGVPLTGVTAIHEDERGRVWVGSGGVLAGALAWDGQRWRRHREPEGVGDYHVHAIRPGRDGDLWFCLLNRGDGFGDEGGVVRLRGDSWRRYSTRDGLPHRRCYDLHAPKSGPMVLATRGGVARFVEAEDRWRSLASATTGRLLDPPYAVHVDPQGVIWAGRAWRNPWVERWEGERWVAVPDSSWSGTAANSFLRVGGDLWCASVRGLFRYRDGTFHEITRESNIPARSFWPMAPDGDGGIWLGSTARGLVNFRPEDGDPPRTESVRVSRDRDGRPVLAWRGSDRWHATPADLLRFRWRVAGGAWSEPIRDREMRIDLPAGDHRIEVQAVDLAGNREARPVIHAVSVPLATVRPWWIPAGFAVLAVAVCTLAFHLGRRRARERTIRSELERFRAILDQAEEAIYVVDPEAWRFVDVNETAARVLGYSRAELLRIGPADIQAGFDVATEDGRQTMVARVRQENRLLIEGRHRRRDGSTFPVELTIAARTFGDREVFLVVARDTTEREEARETEERLRFIVEHTSELIYLQTVPDGKVLFVSPSCERLTGYPPDEYLANAGRIVVKDHPASREFLRIGGDAVRGSLDRIPPYTLALRHKDGGIRIQQVHENYVLYKGQRMLLGVAVDVTEIYEAREAMIHVEKLKSLGILAGGVAHDFNNLLVGVLGNAQLARTHAIPGGDAARYLGEIETAATRAAELCRQLLAYAGKAPNRVERVDLAGLVDEMVRLLQVSIPTRISVELLFEDGLPPVDADPAQLRQVVLNLVTNAAEAIGEADGLIRIAARKVELRPARTGRYVGGDLGPGRYVCLEVSDDGCGMDAETRARIFDPFFTTKFTGRGLGLAAVLGIAQSHGGGMAVETRVGKGSTFRLLLPLGRTPARTERVAESRDAR